MEMSEEGKLVGRYGAKSRLTTPQWVTSVGEATIPHFPSHTTKATVAI
jgi:hypothetical protein